jgi:hypothetical protein
MAETGSKLKTKSEVLTEAVNKQAVKRRVQEIPQDSKFEDIAANIFYKIMFDESKSPEEKKAAVVKAMTAKRNEVVYLTNSQEIDHINNVHSIQGCESLPCTDRDSIYFRIRFSWFNLLWTWVHGKIWFYPDYVAAAVPPVVSKCIITTYGIRLKTFMRSFNMYPDLVQVTCEPILKR